MNTALILRLSFLVTSISLFILGFVFSSFEYRKKYNTNYSFKNMFPIEFNYEKMFNENLVGNLCLIISMFSSICFFVTYNLSFNFDTLIFVTVFGSIASLLIGAMFFVPMKYFRSHIAIDILSFAILFALSAGICIAGFRLFQNGNNTTLALIGFVFALLVTIAIFALIMNPKLSANIKGTVVKDENGKEKVVRPKFIVLAFSEWILIFSFYIDIAISFLISFSLLN